MALAVWMAAPTVGAADAALAAAPVSASAPSTAGAQALVFSPAVLPSARVGVKFAVPLVTGLGRSYRAEISDGKLPPGMQLAADGRLVGTPTEAASFQFMVRVTELANASTLSQQAFRLRVNAMRASPAAPPPATLSPTLANAPPENTDAPHATVWKLTAADLEGLTEAEILNLVSPEPLATPAAVLPMPPPEDAASALEPNPQAPQKLLALITPLLDIEFPTRALFEQALRARQAAVCLQLVQGDYRAKKLEVPESACKPPLVPAKPAAPGAALTLDQFYAAVLPAETQQGLVRVAAKEYRFAHGLAPRWDGRGCGCGPAAPTDQIYGMYPFWQAPLADAPAQKIDFSAYTRIGHLALFMGDDGTVVRSPHWNDQTEGGLRVALRHGTELDLVLYRNEWQRLLVKSDAQLEQVYRRAARDAVALADTPLDNWISRSKRFVLPFWPHPDHLYDGITVFFDYAPVLDKNGKPDRAEAAAFRRFFRHFMFQLITEMERTGRDYALNIVVTESQLWDKDSAHGIEDMLEYLERTRSMAKSSSENAPPEPEAQRSRIKTRLLVLLAEPTTDTKKHLRAMLDRTELLQSHTRIAFLDSLMPVMLFPGGTEPAPMAGVAAFQFDADLAYHNWQFGGVAMWPLTVAGAGASDSVLTMLQHNFRDQKQWWTDQSQARIAVCTFVCPNRTPIRLLLQGLLLLGAVSVGLFLWVCKVRNLGTIYVGYLAVGAAFTALVGFALLSCDPALSQLREGNGLLFTFTALALASVLVWAFTRRVPDP